MYLVVGGGPAGIGAAYSAATAGARVIPAERYGFLGDNATAAWSCPWRPFIPKAGAAGNEKNNQQQERK